jgi:hypothetical protein
VTEQPPEIGFWASAEGWGIEPMPGLLKSVYVVDAETEDTDAA